VLGLELPDLADRPTAPTTRETCWGPTRHDEDKKVSQSRPVSPSKSNNPGHTPDMLFPYPWTTVALLVLNGQSAPLGVLLCALAASLEVSESQMRCVGILVLQGIT